MAVNQANNLSQSAALKCNSASSSTSKLITFEHTWTVECIDQLANDSVRGFPQIQSPIFTAPIDKITTPDEQPVQFQISFYPKGESTTEAQDFVAMFLALKNHSDLTVMVAFSIVMANGQKHHVATIVKLYETGKMSWGLGNFIRKDVLYNQANKFVSDGKLVLHCEVSIITSQLAQPDLSDQLQDKHSPPDLLSESMANLLESGNQSDVTLVMVDDGHEVLRAHKLILVTRSKVFAEMFSFQMAESTSNRIEIQGVKAKVFKQALQHIYTGRVQGSLNGIAPDLLVCADKYQLDSLKSTCEEYLCSQITTKSESALFRLANICGATELKKGLLNFKRQQMIGAFTKDQEIGNQLCSALLNGSYINEQELD